MKTKVQKEDLESASVVRLSLSMVFVLIFVPAMGR